MTGNQQKLYIDKGFAGQFLFYKTDSKIPDIKYAIKFSASQTDLSDEFSISLFSHSSGVLKITQKILFALLLILFCSTAEAMKGSHHSQYRCTLRKLESDPVKESPERCSRGFGSHDHRHSRWLV